MADEKSDVQPWLNMISAYEREFKKWEGRTDKIIKRYRDDRRENRNGDARFNILWSNVQTLVPATFSRIPQPDVSRRFRDNDPVARVAALIVERALEFDIQHYPDYRSTLKQDVTDRFLGGRGTAWVRYEPHIRAKAGMPTDGLEVTEDVDPPEEELDYETAPIDYVHWRDFGHTVARTWEEVTTVWRRVYMTRAGCEARFGAIGKTIPLDSRPEDQKQKPDVEVDSRALIYELWDKETKRAIWISKTLGKIIDEQDDPLGLEGFFPCPVPLFATITNESLIPIPDFSLYQDQANELDTICDRIDGLIKALQVKGVYNAEFKEIGRLFTEGENNTLIPVKNWQAFAEKQGLRGALDIVDLLPIAQALKEAYAAMEQVKQQVYDITGLADIVRGQSVASETATAQQLKGQFASMRLNALKAAVAQFAAEILRLKAQVMIGKFDQETLLKMSGAAQFSAEDQALIPQAFELLSQNPLREFRIDITADSLVEIDENEEKSQRMEMIQAVGTALKNAEPTLQSAPELAPMVMELIKFGVTAFKVGRPIEGVIDEALDKLKASLAQKAQQPPPPNPEMERVKMQAQSDQARVQQQAQSDQMRLQFEQQKAQFDLQLEAEKARREMELEAMRVEFDKWKAQLEAQTKIAVAEISAKNTLSIAQLNAAASGVDIAVDGAQPGPMKEMQDKVEEAKQEVAEAQGQIMEALASHAAVLQAHDAHIAESKKPQERVITMPSGRKYRRVDNGSETQILPVQ